MPLPYGVISTEQGKKPCHSERSEAESRNLPNIARPGYPVRSLHALRLVGMTRFFLLCHSDRLRSE